MHQYANIPAELKQRRNWVAWGIRDAPLKAPFNPAALLSGRPLPAKAGDAETWSSYDDAVVCVRRGLAQGIGYEFDGGDLYGVDLDHVLDGGAITPQAQVIVDKLASYTEISPSGTGLHIFVLAPDADITRHRKKDGFVEIYSTARYFTVTGNVYGGMKPIATRTAELQAVHDKFLLPDTERNIDTIPIAAPALSHSEQERFLHLGLARDKVLAALWGGERRNGNESADDQALMNKLAYWCNANPEVMVAAFLRSPYCAQKDEAHQKKCRRSDYLPKTAMAACATVYSTAKADYDRWQRSRKQSRSYAR